MQRPLILVAVGAVAALGAAAAAGALWYERPTRLTVAVSQTDEPDRALIDSAARLLKRSRKPARLLVQLVADSAAAAEAVDAHRADLAVIRTDIAIPGDAQTVVILHRDAAVLVAPTSSGLKAVSDLPGRTIGMLRMGAGNRSLLATVLAEADLKPDSVTTVELKAEEVDEALRAKRVAAVMAVDVISSSALRAIVRTVSAIDPPTAAAALPAPAAPPPAAKPAGRTGAKPAAKAAAAGPAAARGPAKAAKAEKADEGGDDEAEPPRSGIAFIPIAEAEAIAQRSPAYEKTEVVRGIFGGTPPRPARTYDTLSITHRLVANENVSQGVISDLTRFFLTEKGPIAATAPIAMRIEAPSTDKGASLPVHAGSAAYIDDDEQTFFDKYSDVIYIGAMLIGVLASGVTAVMGRLGGGRSSAMADGIDRLVAMTGMARAADATDALDALQRDADALMARALAGAAPSGGDDRRLASFGLALDQLRAAVRDRRAEIGLQPKSAEIVAMPLAAEERRGAGSGSVALQHDGFPRVAG